MSDVCGFFLFSNAAKLDPRVFWSKSESIEKTTFFRTVFDSFSADFRTILFLERVNLIFLVSTLFGETIKGGFEKLHARLEILEYFNS